MPVALAALDVILIVVAGLAVAITLYLWFRGESHIRNLWLVGNALHDAIQWFIDRNVEVARWIANFAIDLLIEAIHLVNNWIHDISNIFTQPLWAVANIIVHQIGDLYARTNIMINEINLVLFHLIPGINEAINLINTVAIPGIYGSLNIVIRQLNDIVFAQLRTLTASLTTLTGVTIPGILRSIGAIEHTITATIFPDLAALESALNGLAGSFGLLITKPITGLLDRVKGIEGTLARVVPWATVIGLSIPIAENLGRLGRNPCWCSTDGPLQENGDLELAALMDLL